MLHPASSSTSESIPEAASSGRRRVTGIAASIAVLLAALGQGAPAHAQRGRPAGGPQVTISVEAKELYAGLPFNLVVSAEGFDEQPDPEVADFEIPGCTVTFVGLQPSVATSITNINGQVTQTRRVTFQYRYRVDAPAAGRYTVPAIEVTQGPLSASTRPATMQVGQLPTTRDMRIEMVLPERPVSVGETFDVFIDWYLRNDPGDQSFVVPLFDAAEWVEVRAPADAAASPPRPTGFGRRKNALAFQVGDRALELPYTSESAVLDGIEFTRFRFTATITPLKAGVLEIPPTLAVASFRVGTTRDRFGWRAPRMKAFKVEDVARRLEIRPLPMTGRPASFAGAVGTGFSIQVQASKTVVQLGEPIELDILIRGDARMEGLSLPALDNPDGLPASLFSIADTPTVGELVRDNDSGEVKGKRFRVTVRITSPEVTEIPKLGFAYFNPRTQTYETAYSQPIALSVAGSAVVSAGDVVSGSRESGDRRDVDPTRTPAENTAGGSSVVADLSLSPASQTLTPAWSVTRLRGLLLALYAVPLLLLGVQLWRRKTRGARDRSSEARKARRAVERALDDARTRPAREAGPALLAALRGLASAAGRESLRGHDAITRIETVSYDPRAADKPLDGEIVAMAEKLAKSLHEESKSAPRAGALAILLLALSGLALFPGEVVAEQSPDPAVSPSSGPSPSSQSAPVSAAPGEPVTLEAARAVYQRALEGADRASRDAGFAQAERMFRELVAAHPDRPELLTDWGNAALGARDHGTATLAYRRALALDPGSSRAKGNLSWVRSQLPDGISSPGDSEGSWFFFWNEQLAVPLRHFIGALAFALAVLLLVPWSRRPSWLSPWLAVLPALLWLVMMLSIAFDNPPTRDAVVIADGSILLSADSAGAPPAFATPLPAGAEVTIVETREQWVRVALADGRREGWLQAPSLAQVVPP